MTAPRTTTARDPSAPVAVILINWNGTDDTLATLGSLAAARTPGPRPPELWVVDNGSTDDSVERLRAARERYGFHLVETGENLGFAGGNRVGLEHARRDPEVGWFLLLNTDVAVDPGFLPPLLEAGRDPAVGAVGPKIFYFDPPDRLWAAGGRLRLRETVTEEHGRGEPDGPRWSEPRDVSYLTTCCLLIPRDALEQVGPPDPLYFLNVEDADWCRRALDAGYRLRYEPASVIRHKVAASTGGGYTPAKTFHTGRSNTLFVRRHHGPAGLALFLLWNLAALLVAAVRETPRGNLEAVLSKARGVRDGLRAPLPPAPTLGRVRRPPPASLDD